MEKISLQMQEVFNLAYNFALEQRHEYITGEHLLYAALQLPYTKKIFHLCNSDSGMVRNRLEKFFINEIKQLDKVKEPTQSAGFRNIISRALQISHSSKKKEVDCDDVLVAIFHEKDSHASFYMAQSGITRLNLLWVISHVDNDKAEKNDKNSKNQRSEKNVKESGDQEFDDQDEEEIEDFNETDYYTDVTLLAENNNLDPLIGRDDILRRIEHILCRRHKSNPLLLGEPGVGKTALINGLAQAIVAKKTPPRLRDSRLFLLDIGAIIAGSTYRGDFEGRIKALFNHISEQGNVILAIDEIHTIVGAGASSSNLLDAANLLKPYITDRSFCCIGATTYDEYKKNLSRDGALLRRFQRVDVPPTGREESVAIINGLLPIYQKFHSIRIEKSLIVRMVELADLYIKDRFLPDKAIDLLDEIGADAEMERQVEANNKKKTINRKHIEKTVSRIVGVDVKSFDKDERRQLKNITAELKKTIFGQNQAIEIVTDAIKLRKTGFGRLDAPIASLLFVGPTGVGKTEMARRLAETLNVSLHRFDMSEYQEKHTVARLIGSPPGYVGYEEGGLLTDAIRREPRAVLLLDEIEKAHGDIFNTLLQVFDYATLTDSSGRKADFSNAVIIMTSNAGARDMGTPIIGFDDQFAGDSVVLRAVEKLFSSEFRNRLTAMVPFNRLAGDNILKVVERELNVVADRLLKHKIMLEVSHAVKESLADSGYSPEFGARNIHRVIQKKLTGKIVDLLLSDKMKDSGILRLELKDNEIDFNFTPEPKSKKNEVKREKKSRVPAPEA